MKEKIGIGIIGTGFARRTQIPAFIALEKAEIKSVASGSLENAESTAKEFGIEHWTNDWKETVKRADVDLICITTPPNLHLEMTLFALENSKHILCEKPMAMNVTEAAEMTVKAKEKSDLLTIIDHELRFTNGRMKAFEMIREGKLGKIRHAKYHFNNAARGNKDLPWNWWSDEEQGGGALGAIGSHVIDTFHWFLGARTKSVFCQLHTHIKERPVKNSNEQREVTTDDETLLILRFSESSLIEDATASVSISMVEAGSYRNAVEFFGEKGAIRIEDGGEIFLTDTKENTWEKIDFDLGKVASGMAVNGWSRGFVNIADKITSAILEGESKVEHAATFEDGLAVQKVLDAARESDEKGCVVEMV